MTVVVTPVLRCDRSGCRESIAAEPRETEFELRRRAARENGWRVTPSLEQGGHTDLCRWHG